MRERGVLRLRESCFWALASGRCLSGNFFRSLRSLGKQILRHSRQNVGERVPTGRSCDSRIMCPYPVEQVVYLVSGLALLLDRLIKILTISLQPLDLGLETLDSFRDLQHAGDRCQGRLQA